MPSHRTNNSGALARALPGSQLARHHRHQNDVPTQTPSTCTLPLSRRTQSRYCSVQISLLPPRLRYASPKTVHPSAIGRGDVRPPRPCRGKKRLLTPRRMATPARRCSRSRRTGSPHRGAAARAPRAARRRARASPCTRRMGSPERACGWERACGRRTEGPPSSPSKRSRRGARRRPSGPTSARRRRGAAAARVGQGRRTANERGAETRISELWPRCERFDQKMEAGGWSGIKGMRTAAGRTM